MKKSTYLSEVILALERLGGMGSLSEINDIIESNDNLTYIHTNKNWKAQVRTTIQTHCSQTRSYKGDKDIFYSVYGLGEGCWGLKEFYDSHRIEEISPIERRIITSIYNSNLSETEKEMIIKARKGQGGFRKALIEKYNSCIITGIDDKRLLVASHVKPWRSANNNERISPENGLLLSVLYDKLFDSGLISFDENMKIIISSQLSKKNKTILNLNTEKKYLKNPSHELLHNMEYHRDVVFLR